uniref:C-C motif chemokine n=1 Tax=Amphiprion ocellaris TaxID=80972 RepID=A0AAQ5YLI2_AMPOC
MMMKMKIALVTCVLLVSSLAVMASENTFSPEYCCFSFYESRLRKSSVVEVIHTDKLCTKQGVLFKMTNGKKICVDPSVQWVKNIIEAKNKELVEK